MHQRVVFPYYPGRVGVPSNTRGFTSTFRTLPNIWCGLRKQAPQSTKSPIRPLIRFLVPRITLRTYNTALFTTPANYNAHIYMFRVTCNDTRLLDNRNPPTVDHNYKSHTPDTVNHTDIYNTRPIVALPPPPPPARTCSKQGTIGQPLTRT